jgi:hypothetical protein
MHLPVILRLRALLAAAALASSITVAPPLAGSAAAYVWPSYCNTYACATMTITFQGAGSGHVIDDQGGIDCY